jgi:hypothetical protein
MPESAGALVDRQCSAPYRQVLHDLLSNYHRALLDVMYMKVGNVESPDMLTGLEYSRQILEYTHAPAGRPQPVVSPRASGFPTGGTAQLINSKHCTTSRIQGLRSMSVGRTPSTAPSTTSSSRSASTPRSRPAPTRTGTSWRTSSSRQHVPLTI